MSENQGKKGEMVLSTIAASIGFHENGVDFTRPSVTNSADMGADLFLLHPEGFLTEKLLPVANGTYLPPPTDAPTDTDVPCASTTTQKTRIDTKTTTSKLGSGTVVKFIADIHKHPDCTGHLLIGGSGLTKPAEQKFAQAQKDFREHGKILAHVNNDGVRSLAAHYRPPELNSDQSDSHDNVARDNHNEKDSDSI